MPADPIRKFNGRMRKVLFPRKEKKKSAARRWTGRRERGKFNTRNDGAVSIAKNRIAAPDNGGQAGREG